MRGIDGPVDASIQVEAVAPRGQRAEVLVASDMLDQRLERRWGFEQATQSHLLARRDGQRLVVPEHRELLFPLGQQFFPGNFLIFHKIIWYYDFML